MKRRFLDELALATIKTFKLKSKLISLIFVSLFLTLNTLYSQKFEWAKSFGGAIDDLVNAIVVDSFGNVYSTGDFVGTVDFNPGSGTSYLVSSGVRDIFIQKMDSNGNFIWAKSFGGTSDDIVKSLVVDAAGNLYTAGVYKGTADFDPGPGNHNLTSNGGFDIFIQKLDSNGNFLWAKSYGGPSIEAVYSIAIDSMGSVYSIGHFFNSIDFDPGAGVDSITSAGASDIFVQKLDSNGNFLWVKSFGNGSNDYGYSITLDSMGNTHITGVFGGTVDFDPGIGTYNLVTPGHHGLYVQKMDNNGNFIWAKSFTGDSISVAISIVVDTVGNVYSTGCFKGTKDFDPGPGISNLTSEGDFDVYVHKMDYNGNLIWVKSFGGILDVITSSIAIDTSGNVYTSGYFKGITDVDPEVGTYYLTSVGRYDAFIHKMDVNGNFLWAKSFGDTLDDYAKAIAMDGTGSIFTAGAFAGTVDFDAGAGISNLISTGDVDAFIQKMSPCKQSTSTDVQTSCDSFIWIDGITYSSSNNTATFTLSNATGCDSVIALNLTINTISVLGTTTNGASISSNNTNANYQWLDCDNNHDPIIGETNQSFTANASGNYAVEISESGCTDTSDCVSIILTEIIENDFGNEIIFFPNPSTGTFYIDLGEFNNSVKVTLIDMKGRLILSQEYHNTQLLDLKIVEPKGLYLLIIESEHKRAIVKLLKK